MKLERLAELNLRARSGPLSPAEDAEREHLRTILPTVARGERSPELVDGLRKLLDAAPELLTV